MITVDEIKKKAANLYFDYLKSLITGEVFFPKTIRSNKSVSDDFNILRKELAQIIEFSKDQKSYGYSITYNKISTRKHGVQDLPEEISFQTETDYLKFLHKVKEVAEFNKNVEQIIDQFPCLKDWSSKYPQKIIQNSFIWFDLLKVCNYFIQNSRPNLYIRELPIKIHTKFIENNKGILYELLNNILSVSDINEEFIGIKDFEKRFGLKYNQSQIRIRILDENISKTHFSGLSDIEIIEEEFNDLRIACNRVFILENKTNFSNIMNFLTLPHLKETIAIFGSGFKLGNLKNAKWLSEKELYYWGDIDTHGLQILSQIKGYFPKTKSIMMDFETLNYFKDDWGRGESTSVKELKNLSQLEHNLFAYVKENDIRLEQEKITQEYLNGYLETFFNHRN